MSFTYKVDLTNKHLTVVYQSGNVWVYYLRTTYTRRNYDLETYIKL